MEEHENDMFMQERVEIDEFFFRQPAILKQNLHVESLGTPTPPNGDPVFDLKVLPDTLKYAYLDEKKIYLLLSILTFQGRKRIDYWKFLGNIDLQLVKLWMIFMGFHHLCASTLLILSMMRSPFLITKEY